MKIDYDGEIRDMSAEEEAKYWAAQEEQEQTEEGE